MVELTPRLLRFAAAFATAAGLPNPPAPIRQSRAQTANYAQSRLPKKSTLAHFPISSERQTALDIIRWCYAVANIRADSPRFCYYVSRWNVPAKITRAIDDGTFDQITANCPPIDPTWTRLVPAALDEWRAFTAKTSPAKAPISCTAARS